MDTKKTMVYRISGLVVLAALVFTACQPVAGDQGAAAAPTANAYFTLPTAVPTMAAVEATAKVTVTDQSVDGGQLTVAEVDSPRPGWLVIHVQTDGKPGAVLGYTPVKAGVNTNVMVMVDDSEATPVLYAMLHADAGKVGVYEFPGADAPVQVDGQMVAPAFNVTGGSSQSKGTSDDSGGYDDYGKSSNSKPTTEVSSTGIEIKVLTQAGLGTFLVDEKGMTLYLYTKDTPGVSNCKDACLTAWPPLLTSGDPRADDGVTASKLGTITRDDGSLQVTYNDLPLYYYISDAAPGDTVGQGVGGVWFVVAP
ncbi:MAG: COG4315 family predicted lipoprotein [Bellilinea sp.]